MMKFYSLFVNTPEQKDCKGSVAGLRTRYPGSITPFDYGNRPEPNGLKKHPITVIIQTDIGNLR